MPQKTKYDNSPRQYPESNILDMLDEAVFRLSYPGGICEFANRAVEPVFGFSPDSWHETPHFLSTIVHPEFKERYENFWNRLADPDSPEELEYKIMDRQGKERWIRQKACRVFNKDIGLESVESCCARMPQELVSEEEAAKRRRIFERYIEKAPFGFFLLNKAGRCVKTNRAAQAMTGYSEEELLGMAIADMVVDVGLVYGFHKKLVAGESQNREIRYYHKDGSIRWLNVEAEKIDDDNYVSFSTDITEKIKLEKERKANQDRVESLLRITQFDAGTEQSFLDYALEEAIKLTQSKIGYIYHYNALKKEFTLNTWSKGVFKKCGINNAAKVYHQDNTGLWGEAVRQRKPIVVNDFDAPNEFKKGYPKGHVNLEKYMTIPVIIDGVVQGVVGVANKEADYTVEDANHLTLMMDYVWRLLRTRRLKDEYQELFNIMDSAVALHEIILDADGHPCDYIFQDINPAFEKQTGLKREEIIGRRVSQVLPDMDPDWIERYGKVALTQEPISFSSYDPSLDRRFDVVAYSPSPGQFAVIFTDVTESYNFQKDIIEAKSRAEIANRAKSEFLANMSHELRTPLNGIMGMLQLLGTTELTTEQTDYTGYAINSCKNLTSLLTDILDLSVIESGKMKLARKHFRLKEILEVVTHSFSQSVKTNGIKLELQIDSRIPPILAGDPVRIRQIVFNLVGNAVKFTDQGKIKIAAYPTHFTDSGDFRLILEVTDTGIGIADDMLEFVFEPFTQVEQTYTRQHQGVGLGLQIVKKIVLLMNGDISICSEQGLGTTVHVSIPMESAKVSSEHGVQTLVKTLIPADMDKPSILVVEDDPTNLKGVTSFLKSKGYEVATAENGRKALDILRDSIVDLVLMDIRMPVMNGVEATEKIRTSPEFKHLSNIPIIALTAYAMKKDRDNFLDAGADDYVAKPVDYNELVAKMNKLLSR